MSDLNCYHCGLPIPQHVNLPVTINGSLRSMCCHGCQTVAQSIVASGLDDYYRNRDALPESPRESIPSILEQLKLFDHAEFQKSFVRALGPSEREASLLLEGITCAACIWLNEEQIGRLKGVSAVDINYATRRARVRWDDSIIHLSDILSAISAIGYRAYPYDPAKNELISRKERRDALWRVWVAGFGMMQVMMYAFPVYIADGDMTEDIETLMRWASLLLTLPVVFYSSAPFFRNAWRDIKLQRVGMDTPVALGVGAAFVASCWATFMQNGEVYFDSVTMFVFFLLGGRYLEMTARQKAVSVTEALARIVPSFAERLPNFPADYGSTQCVVGDLQPGDVVSVRPGDIIPSDGQVLEGVSAVDESLLTGESRPVDKAPGDCVTAGSINTRSPLVVKVDQVGAGTRLSAIINLMERAAIEKPNIVKVADRVASYFVAVLLIVAVFVALGWVYLDPDKALSITVSVLVVTCPCALSLATPIALTVASGVLAKNGLLLTRGHAIETMARATHFVFDKTGTLTTGKMQLLDVFLTGAFTRSHCLEIAAVLESASEHPIGKALWSAAVHTGDVVTKNIHAEPGMGVEAEVNQTLFRIGRPDYVLALSGAEKPKTAVNWQKEGNTVVLLGNTQGCLAVFCLSDEVRYESSRLIDGLLKSGRKISLLTGDAVGVANRVAKSLNITEIRAGVSPEEKHQYVKKLQNEGAVVAMVGDGVNDAPVLAQAQVSIAMGGGAQLARTQADFVLLSENLEHLRLGVNCAEKTLKIIRQNLWWAFAYNFLALPLAIMGYVSPWMAGIGMSASSLLVVLNSLRIQRQG